MLGIDISNYQRGIDLSSKEIEFVIMKATEGVGFMDKSLDKFLAQLTGLNKLTGLYHFARPDYHGTPSSMKKEADWFVTVAEERGLIGKSILVLDWEREPMDNEGLIRSWLERVEELTGVKPFVYGSRSKLTNQAFTSVLRDYPAWMAVWPTLTPIELSSASNFVCNYKPAKSRVNWKIWQFSSRGCVPGFSGDVDFDYSDMGRKEWEFWCKKVTEPEVISSDMEWAIDHGLFAGYGNGKYGPKDPLTREQAATVFHAMFDLLTNSNSMKGGDENENGKKEV